MAGKQTLIMAVVVLVLVAGVRTATRLGDCTHNNHCGSHSCCLVGFNRYSIPSCSPRGDIGSYCRGSSVPELVSHTLYYPTDISVVIEAGHTGLCPCRSGLVCTMGKCQMPGPDTDTPPSLESNSLNSEYDQ